MAVFKRTWRLQIQIKDSVKTYQETDYADRSLKIDFDITNGVYGGFANGNISVCNLDPSDMEYLASCMSPYGMFKKNKVTLEVGYMGNMGVIFSGNIIEVSCDFQSPDKKINFRVIGGIGNNLTNNSVDTSFKGKIDFKKICEDCASKNGLQLKYDSKLKERLIDNFSFVGSPFQMIERLRSYFKDLNIFINETNDILNVLLIEDGEEINKQELSKDTGLIGKPRPTRTGVDVTCLLNINLKAGGRVKLKNETLSQFDGVYRIQELKHRGSNYGDTWVSELRLFKAKG